MAAGNGYTSQIYHPITGSLVGVMDGETPEQAIARYNQMMGYDPSAMQGIQDQLTSFSQNNPAAAPTEGQVANANNPNPGSPVAVPDSSNPNPGPNEFGTASPYYQTPAPAYQAPGASPEANSSINGGSNLNSTPPAPGDGLRSIFQPLGSNTVSPNPVSSPSGPNTPPAGSPPPSGSPQAPAPNSNTFKPPMNMDGLDMAGQAKSMTDYLKSIGINVQPFSVGGTSPWDNQINADIKTINDPNSTDAQRRAAGQDIATLLPKRNQSATGQVNTYDPTTGSFKPNGVSVTGSTGNPGPGPNGPGTMASQSTRDMLSSILSDFAGGSAAQSAEQRRQGEARFVTDAGNAARSQRTALANRLGAMGVQGGAAADMLNQADAQALNSKDSNLANLDAAIMQQQQQSKRDALSSVLQMEGMDQNKAMGLANLAVTQRGQDINLGISNNNSQMALLTHLLDLAWSGDQNAQASLNTLIQQLIMGTPQNTTGLPTGA